MECVLTANQIKVFHRAITCLARIGNELLIEALSDKMILRTLNASRSAFLAISFKAQFFDAYQLLVPVAQCSVLLKAVCTVFRMAPSSMERIAIILPDMVATKLQWTLECFHGIRKTYWITCTNEPEMQHVALDRKSFPSHLVVKPCDLNRLLANFQSSLQEITLIATEPSPVSSSGITKTSPEGKAVELRSYIDPVKENNDAALHTQLWIDPAEELQEYVHRGTAVDVTFSIKELKAFLAFCEGSEADMHLFFERAGNPVLLAPRFGLDDLDHADFDATLVLATMLGSQLREAESSELAPPQAAGNSRPTSQVNGSTAHDALGPRPSSQRVQRTSISSPKSAGEHSDHTKIWSEISGSATKSWDNRDAAREPVYMQDSNDASEEILVGLQQQQLHQANANQVTAIGRMAHLRSPASSDLLRGDHNCLPHVMETCEATGEQVPTMPIDENIISKRNPGNWLSADIEEDEDEDDGDDLCVQSTPPQRRGMI